MFIYEVSKKYSVEIVDPSKTIENRNILKLEKSHINDAISLYGINVKINCFPKFKIENFSNHKRQATVRIEDRKYIIKNNTGKRGRGSLTIVAKNRKRRFEQDYPSLEEIRKEDPKIINKVKVEKGGPKYRSKTKFKPGTVIEFKNKHYVVKGIKNGGKTIITYNGENISYSRKNRDKIKIKRYLKLVYSSYK